jgi:conjugal transfer pilus assembly protein TraA
MNKRIQTLFQPVQQAWAAKRNLCLRAGIAGAGVLASISPAMAGTTGSEFESLYNLVRGWSDGYLGKTLAIAAFLVGAIVGFAKSTAMPALIGIVFAVLFSIGPSIIDGITTATI